MVAYHKITADQWMIPEHGTLRRARAAAPSPAAGLEAPDDTQEAPDGTLEAPDNTQEAPDGAVLFNDGTGLGLHQIACLDPTLPGKILSVQIVVAPHPDCSTDLCLQHWGAREIAVISPGGAVVRAPGTLTLRTWRHPDGAIGIEASWLARHGSIVLGTCDKRSRYLGHGRDQYWLRSIGYAAHPAAAAERRWSETVEDYYPISPQPRWGYARPPHPQVSAALERGRTGYRQVLETLASARAVLHRIGHDPDPTTPGAPFWNNSWFSVLDAASLVGFILDRQPRRYLEIGSGHSTMFARAAIQAGGGQGGGGVSTRLSLPD